MDSCLIECDSAPQTTKSRWTILRTLAPLEARYLARLLCHKSHGTFCPRGACKSEAVPGRSAAVCVPPRLGVSFYLGTNEGTPRRGGAAKSKHPHMLSDLSPGNASKPPKDGSAKLRRQNFTMLMCE